jgi:hypothetical protein
VAGDRSLQQELIKLLLTAPRGSPFDMKETGFWIDLLSIPFESLPVEASQRRLDWKDHSSVSDTCATDEVWHPNFADPSRVR